MVRPLTTRVYSLKTNVRSLQTVDSEPKDLIHPHPVYLIVVIVGLFVLLVLAIMLSAWCCRGAFENPLCCPCYLCACCGGLGEHLLIVSSQH